MPFDLSKNDIKNIAGDVRAMQAFEEMVAGFLEASGMTVLLERIGDEIHLGQITNAPMVNSQTSQNYLGASIVVGLFFSFSLKTVEYKYLINGNVINRKVFFGGQGVENYLVNVVEALNHLEKETRKLNKTIGDLQKKDESHLSFLAELAKLSIEQKPENIVIYLN